jgi:N-acetylglucosaminyl-diphospho-decaprenol L-rhamnosyltransferase
MKIAGAAPARVRVVIVNYRTGGHVVACLRSLAPEVAALGAVDVVVVDNCSGDDSAEVIDRAIDGEGWRQWASVTRAPLNGGFAYGNNLAVRPALAEPDPPRYFWILNPDTEVRPGALVRLLEFVEQRPRVGIAGSSFELADGSLWPHAFRFPSIWSEIATALRLNVVGRLLARRVVLLTMGDRPERVDWLPGASMLVRREVFEQVGLMDDGYFLYFEETDFCLQAARAGWECWYVPASRVMHMAGQSTGVTTPGAAPTRRPAYWFESRRRYWIKQHGWCYAALTDLAWVLCFGLWQVRRVLQRKPRVDPPRMLIDFVRNSALLHTSMPGNRMLAPHARDNSAPAGT